MATCLQLMRTEWFMGLKNMGLGRPIITWQGCLVATGPVVPADHAGPGRCASHTSPQGLLTAPLGIDGAPFSPAPRGDLYSMVLVPLLLILLPALSDGPPVLSS